MDFKTVAYGSSEHKETLKLRNDILRVPLGLPADDEDSKDEYKATHVIGCEGDKVICGLILWYLRNGNWALQQTYVLPECQGRGIGRELLAFAEDYVSNRGARRVEMIVRTSAKGFYEKNGYTQIGEEFPHKSVPSIKMEKPL